MSRGLAVASNFGRWTNAERVWLVDKGTGEIREITGDEYNRMGQHPNGWDHFGVRAFTSSEAAARVRAEILATLHTHHTFATLGEGRQFEDCQMCGLLPPKVVCGDCDLEICLECQRKGDPRGQVHEGESTASAS